jgi:hypothetical protein
MVTPENRFEMLKRTHRLVREKKVLFADFWNSGVVSYGCISAGRPGGHYYIDWNGDVTPCVFVPYAVDNIYSVFRRGGDLDTLRDSPFFRRIRDWQNEFGFTQPGHKVDNWFRPCPIRDHFDIIRAAARETGARPINESAAAALEDPEYRDRMVEYAERFDRACSSLWTGEYAADPAAK